LLLRGGRLKSGKTEKHKEHETVNKTLSIVIIKKARGTAFIKI
jgi:hypothetical protein